MPKILVENDTKAVKYVADTEAGEDFIQFDTFTIHRKGDLVMGQKRDRTIGDLGEGNSTVVEVESLPENFVADAFTYDDGFIPKG